MADQPLPPALSALSIIAARSGLPASSLVPLANASLVLDTAWASNPAVWAQSYTAKYPWVNKIRHIIGLGDDEGEEKTRESVARTAMRCSVYSGNTAALSNEEREELKEEIEVLELRFAAVLEEVRGLEGKDGIAEEIVEEDDAMETEAGGPSGPAKDSVSAQSASDTEMDTKMDGQNEGLKPTPSASVLSLKSRPQRSHSSGDELADDMEHLSVSSGASRDSISPLEPTEHLLLILDALPTHLPAIHLLAFLQLLEGNNEACLAICEIGLGMAAGAGAEFAELKAEAESRISGPVEAAPSSATTLSDANNPPTFLSSSLLSALLQVFRRFGGDDGNVLSAAEFATVVQKANGRAVDLKQAKAMVAALEGGVEFELREWTESWLASQPTPEPEPEQSGKGPRVAPPRRVVAKSGLSLAGWFLFFSRQVHTEDGEEETRADLEKLGWSGEI